MPSESQFVHLHCHSHYSLLKSVITPEMLVEKAKKLGYTSIALTDENAMYGAIEFYKVAKKAGIKPIIGCDLNVRCPETNDVHDIYGKCVLLAENKNGYQNLLKLASIAQLNAEEFGYIAAEWKDLIEHSDGIIVLTGSMNGLIPKLLSENMEKEVISLLTELKQLGDSIFLEIQHHPKKIGQNELNAKLRDLSQSMDIPLVAAHDVHYIDSKDIEAHEIMLCIGQNAHRDDTDRFSMKDSDYSLLDQKHMCQHFKDVNIACQNSVAIAKRCSVDFKFGNFLMPKFTLPEGKTSDVYLIELCVEGLKKRYNISIDVKDFSQEKYDVLKESEQKICKRLHFELQTIHKMSFDTYFLIVWDFIKYAKKKGILVGPGRGSAAGAIVSYCLEVTDLDPLKYDLLFERFLNPERSEMPDIDMDFEDTRRDEVIEYVVERYGKDHVAQISTFGTLAARAAIKDVGRGMGVPFLEMNNLAKLIPARPGITLQEVLKTKNSELKIAYNSSPLYKEIIDIARRVEGLVRHISVHACAVVISPEPIQTYTAIQHPPKDPGSIITQYSAKPLGALGLLKMDFLGLRNLTIIRKTLDLIKERHNQVIVLSDISLEDEKTYKVFAEGRTTGVFQFESAGMRRYLKELVPTEIEDVIAMAALYRPGPMDWIPDYIKSKHDPKRIKYIHPSLKPFLKKTYGVAVYQEQVMQIAQEFSNLSLGDAYILLKGIAKKVPEIVQQQKKAFMDGAIVKGHSDKLAQEIFEKVIEPFAGYGFNKSHAACYAYIAYQTAYLKAHYPAEFMTALMSSDADDADRINIEIDECKMCGIAVLPPDVNCSEINFSIEADNTIRFGLNGIKGLGTATAEKILEIRKAGKFKTIVDFLERLDSKLLNKKTLEALGKSGSLDSLVERNQVLENIPSIQSFLKKSDSMSKSGGAQTSLFSTEQLEEIQSTESLALAPVEPATQMQRLSWEKELLGVYISEHPLDGMGPYLKSKVSFINKIQKIHINKSVTVGGIASKLKTFKTRKGDSMGVFELEGVTDKIEITLFPETYRNFFHTVHDGDFVFVKGKIGYRNNNFQILAQKIEQKDLEALQKEAKLFDANQTSLIQSEDVINHEQQASTQTRLLHFDESNNHILIYLPANVEKKDLVALRDILKSHPGRSYVELNYPGKQNIPVPYKATYSKELYKDIENWQVNLQSVAVA